MTTLLGVFRETDDSEAVLDQLTAHGIDRSAMGLVWREKEARKLEDVEVIEYVDHFEGPRREAKKGAIGGAVGGLTAALGSYFLSSAGVSIGPEMVTLIGAGAGVAAAITVAALAGAAGGVSGGAIGAILGASDHDATKVRTVESQYRDVVETDGFVVAIEVAPDQSEELASALHEAGAHEVSVLGLDGAHLRTPLETPFERTS